MHEEVDFQKDIEHFSGGVRSVDTRTQSENLPRGGYVVTPLTAKTSLRLKRKRAAWDDDIRMKMLGLHPL